MIRVSENHAIRVQTSVLNEVIMDAVAMNPTPTIKGRRLKIYYTTQVAIKPPTFVVFVNDPEIMHFSYERFLENRIRDAFDFEGTPIRIIATKKKIKRGECLAMVNQKKKQLPLLELEVGEQLWRWYWLIIDMKSGYGA